MTALGIEMSTRDADLFYWPAPSTRGKSPEYLAVSDKIEELWARFIRICEYAPQEKHLLNPGAFCFGAISFYDLAQNEFQNCP